MTKYKIIFLSLLINFFWSCEPNDICEEGTAATPRLIIEFYDNASPSNTKNVTDLKVQATGEQNGIVFNTSADDDEQYRYTGTKISIPLRINTDVTEYKLTLNEGSTTVGLSNEDTITITYFREDEFISRACGYKTVFELSPTVGIVLNAADTNPWIQQIQILKTNIINEDEVHVQIFL